ncbi:MAG: SpoIIE family protein phosphatase [Chlorobi bacterium]|nr:SpoIIE family protein phosphatase [Chlorobiota bacterium]
MKKNILFILFLYLSSAVFSQVNKNGLPFVTKYTDKDYGEVGQLWAITRDNRGIMYFGCNYGLKTYDGRSWKTYNNPYSTIIRSLNTDKKGLVYYGAENDFGVFLAGKSGELEFHSLFRDKFKADSVNFGSVWKTVIAENRVYYMSFEKLFYVDLPLKFSGDSLTNEIKIIPPSTMFHNSFEVDDVFYIREWEKGLCTVENGKLKLVPGGEKFAFLRIYVMFPYDKNRILIGTREEGFFLFDKTKNKNTVTPFNIENNQEIIKSAIYTGTKLLNGKFAVGTLADGIFVIDKNGKIINHYNEKFGLPSQYILAMYYNSGNPDAKLWYFSQDNGIFNLDISGNITKWDKSFGIDGIVNDIIRYKSKLYFTVNNSLLYLNTKSKYPEFHNIYSENENVWKFLEFKIPGSNKTKLLMASVSGIFEIKDTLVSKIADINNVRVLTQSEHYPERLYIGSDDGLAYMNYTAGSWSELTKKENFPNSVCDILETDKYLATGVFNKGIYIFKNFDDENPVYINESRGLNIFGSEYFLKKIKDKTIAVTGSGLYFINDSLRALPFDYFGKQYCDTTTGIYLLEEFNDKYWMSVYSNDITNPNHRLIRFKEKPKLVKDSIFANILPRKITFCLYPDNNIVWIGNEGGLFTFDRTKQKNYKVPFHTVITRILTSGDSVLFSGNFMSNEGGFFIPSLQQSEDKIPVLPFKSNNLVFEWAAPYFEKEKETLYSYRLIGESDEWSKWSKKTDIRYTNLYEGEYTFEVKARNIYNVESTVAKYKFVILSPWYRTIWAYLLFFILGILFILLIIKLYTKKLKRENEKLEQTVKERTAEIRMQNEEITAQRDEIQAQKEEVEKAKDKIEKQQKSIMDSIHYASRIQEAVLPPDEYLDEILGNHFVLFRPRDIVSGDFYWATQRDGKTVIVAADCTGHGVPGAFMSMLGMSFLNEIVNKEGILQANVILNRLRENVKKSLRQTGKENEAKDGMDIALCIIDKDEMKLQFAGAYNPLLLLRNGEITRIKADRMPIGIYLREKESFTNNIIDLEKGDLLYIFSDGYVDQFGGEDDSKIRSANFKKILLENHKKPLDEQKAALVKFLEDWMNHTDKTGRKYKQVDDILVVGIEI